jgi:hypothetical protein
MMMNEMQANPMTNSTPTPIGSAFWGWAITGSDVDASLREAIAIYRRRYGQEPTWVLYGREVTPAPVAGLKLEPHPFVPARAFYFVLPGSTAAAAREKEVMSLEVV